MRIRDWRSDVCSSDLWCAVPGWYRVPAFILSRGWEEEGGKRKQEKGTVSRQVPSVCLHIVFSRDIPRFARDMLARNAGNPPFQARIREIRPQRRAAMSDDDEFTPRLGRQRQQGGKRARSHLGRVVGAATRPAEKGWVRPRRFGGRRSGLRASSGRLF